MKTRIGRNSWTELLAMVLLIWITLICLTAVLVGFAVFSEGYQLLVMKMGFLPFGEAMQYTFGELIHGEL